MTYPKWVADTAKENRRVIYPGTGGGDVAKREGATVVLGFLFEYGVLLTLADHSSLVGAEYLVCLGDR
jgi:hypothetical protein